MTKLSIKKQKKAKIENKKGILNMKFYNEEHQNYFNEMSQKRKLDVYNKSIIYLLGLTEETRKHTADIYNIEKGEINIEGLEKAWQTGTTSIICRLAFNLFNGRPDWLQTHQDPLALASQALGLKLCAVTA